VRGQAQRRPCPRRHNLDLGPGGAGEAGARVEHRLPRACSHRGCAPGDGVCGVRRGVLCGHRQRRHPLHLGQKQGGRARVGGHVCLRSGVAADGAGAGGVLQEQEHRACRVRRAGHRRMRVHCMHGHTSAHRHIHIHIHIRPQTSTRVHTRPHASTHIDTHPHTCAHIHTACRSCFPHARSRLCYPLPLSLSRSLLCLGVHLCAITRTSGSDAGCVCMWGWASNGADACASLSLSMSMSLSLSLSLSRCLSLAVSLSLPRALSLSLCLCLCLGLCLCLCPGWSSTAWR